MIQIKEALAEAKGESEVINIKEAALRNNPEVLKLEVIQKWDGKLPKKP